MTGDDMTLVREFVARRSEPAFGQNEILITPRNAADSGRRSIYPTFGGGQRSANNAVCLPHPGNSSFLHRPPIMDCVRRSRRAYAVHDNLCVKIDN
jgi:hypothetical protein